MMINGCLSDFRLRGVLGPHRLVKTHLDLDTENSNAIPLLFSTDAKRTDSMYMIGVQNVAERMIHPLRSRTYCDSLSCKKYRY